ncbi:MAG: S8/S53 family peptidase [Candidatus Neomarinimicrobiota bacterium]
MKIVFKTLIWVLSLGFSPDLLGGVEINLESLEKHVRTDGRIKAWIYFTDKGDPARVLSRQSQVRLSEKVIQRRAKVGIKGSTWYDTPVNIDYIQSVLAGGADLQQESRWLNAISVFSTLEELSAIAELTWVKEIIPVFTHRRQIPEIEESKPEGINKSKSGPFDYGAALEQIEQINVQEAHTAGYFGQGVIVLILDTGFYTEHEVFDSLTIIATRDFINDDEIVSNEPGQDVENQQNHGTYTFSALGGYAPGKLVSPAFKAEFILAKTERLEEEIQQEEDDYVAALEWGESLGADIVSSSLGYLDWYTFQDLDGNTAVTTKAVDIAVSLGMVCVTAAGNENGSSWNHIIAPADADSVISVGAVDRFGNIASFSSRGPSADGRIKPEVCARGVATACATPSKLEYTNLNGTSLSTPLVAGAAALILSANPEWTPMMVREALLITASKYLNPDNTYGWGIIDVWTAINYDGFETGTEDEKFIPELYSISRAYPNPFNPMVNFSVNIGTSGSVTLTVFNLLGQPVENIYQGLLARGLHKFRWNASGRSTGIYFIHLESDEHSFMRKITYLK